MADMAGSSVSQGATGERQEDLFQRRLVDAERLDRRLERQSIEFRERVVRLQHDVTASQPDLE